VSDYTHAIFSDFSGDDGIMFDRGSSSCLTLAYVVSREQDIRYNEDVLYQMKDRVACRRGDELKYSSLRRPANKEAVLDLFPKLKVDIACVTTFKRSYFEQEQNPSYADPRTKMLVVVNQAFPFASLLRSLQDKYGHVKPRIVVDQLHWKGIQESIVELLSRNEEWFKEADFQFRPSGGTPLLQLADLFCGAVREFCEGIEGQDLPPCHVCRSRKFKPRDCSWRRDSRRPVGFRIMKSVYPFLLGRKSRIPFGMYFEPRHMNDRLEFIDCFLAGK